MFRCFLRILHLLKKIMIVMIFNLIIAKLKSFFLVSITKEDEEQIVKSIESDIRFRGMNLWVLIFAIFIASLGLNVNSTAVIIGAMLISPLMGPIIGMGLAVGISDLELLKRSAKNFGVATGISVLTAMIYFILTPLNEAQSELLARTSPNIYDVLIALFGGLAGIVAICSRNRGNVLPGVAIATALMPPLCTAGYGLATAQWTYFFGAFYLYFINMVFITVATFIGVRMMGFAPKTFVDTKKGLLIKRYIYVVIIATVIPAIYLTYNIVKESIYNSKAMLYINNELAFDNVQVIQKNVSYKDRTIRVVLMGEEIPEENIALAEAKISKYKDLHDTKLTVIQGINNNEIDISSIKTVVMKDFYEKSEKTITEQERRIEYLENELEKRLEFERLSSELRTELSTLFPGAMSFSLSNAIRCYMVDSVPSDTFCLAAVAFDEQPSEEEIERLRNWLQARVKVDRLELNTK